MTNAASSSAAGSLGELLSPVAEKMEPAIASWLEDPSVPGPLAEAMRYSCLDGGKRLRPALVLFSAEAVAERPRWRADPTGPAVAVELVHCYSLVHDDLPAMDDDDLRRGRPTTHVQFGEAMAILAGDALLTRAFEVITASVADRELGAELAAELAAAAGPAGMIAGQVADMNLCPVPDGLGGAEYVHLRKTAALIRAAVRMGAMCAGAGQEALAALGAFGECLGLAFQITDDLLDATAAAETLGKTPGKDACAGKRTYVAEIGLDAARRLADELCEKACRMLEGLTPRPARLRQLAALLGRRDR